MTSEQVVRQLKKWFPGKCFILTKRVGVYPCDHAEDDVAVEYTLAVLPGLDGSRCQLFNGSTPAHCLDKYVTAVQKKDDELSRPSDELAAVREGFKRVAASVKANRQREQHTEPTVAVQTRDGRDKVNADSMAAAVAERNQHVIDSEQTPERDDYIIESNPCSGGYSAALRGAQ